MAIKYLYHYLRYNDPYNPIIIPIDIIIKGYLMIKPDS